MAIIGLSTFGPCTLQAYAEVAVEASLSHLSFPQDKAARLTITITGRSRNTDIDLPQIDGIRLHNRGQSSQISVVNGAMSSSISHNYLVQAEKPGPYTIPSIEVSVGGKSYSTKPISFEVSPAGQQVRGYSGKTDQREGEIAFIRTSETGSHYPGEIVPITIKAYFTQDYRADINSLPTLRGDGVVMSQLQDKPKQTEELVNSRKYHVLTWETSLSGIKVGEHPMSFSLDATMLIPQKRRSRSPFGGSRLFDDSFLNDSFFGSHQRKPIVSVSPEVVFNVLPLPTVGQPDNFTGAIGNFDLKIAVTPVDVEIGEPMTLTMEISGTGNFDRVEAPVFPETPNWKTYSPTSDFSEQGRHYAGTKVFEQAVVVRSGAVSQIPSLSFSYFNPEEKRYITKTSKAVAINLKNPLTQSVAHPILPVIQPSQQPVIETAATPSIEGLAPIHLETGNFHARLVPLFKSSWLITVCSLCILLLLLLFILKIRQQNIEKHPEIQLKKQKKLLFENDLKKVEQAQAAGDGFSFLSFSRTAIQNQLGLLWNIEPAALSLADIRSRLKVDSQLIEIFSVAEEAAYGGASLTSQKMQEYYTTLKTELEELL
ncbi:MAG: protein BatD [Desulfobulbaceae bacterium]|nr:protein BatD [Desulfobulbaceae bacterium]